MVSAAFGIVLLVTIGPSGVMVGGAYAWVRGQRWSHEFTEVIVRFHGRLNRDVHIQMRESLERKCEAL